MAHSYIETNDVSNQTIVVGDALKYIAFADLLAFGKLGDTYTPLTIASRDEFAKSVTISEDISAYDLVRIARNTSLAQLVDFHKGSRLSESDLDTAYQQGLFAAQEAAEDALATGQRTIIAEADIAPNAVTSDKVADGSVTETKIADGSISTNKLAANSVTFAKLASDALAAAYPVGSIYMNATNAANPSTLLGFGTWVEFSAGRVPVGIDSGDTDFDTAEATGGAKTHTLTESEMPAHTHGDAMLSINSNSGRTTFTNRYLENSAERGTFEGNTDATGGDEAHNNLQPYIVVYMWKRVA